MERKWKEMERKWKEMERCEGGVGPVPEGRLEALGDEVVHHLRAPSGGEWES